MKDIVVSIIMATYNREDLILETLNSIRQQTYANWECIIIDDGGQDNTSNTIGPLLKEDTRFKYYNRPNTHKKGLPGCRNYGVSLSQAKYIIFFDDDDIVHPHNLALCVKELELEKVDYCRYKRTVFYEKFHYNFDLSDTYNKNLLEPSVLGDMIMGNLPFNSCTVLWKAACLEKNKFNENLMFAEEWECYSRILSNGAVGVTIDKVLFFGRKHDKSNTGEFQRKDPVRLKSKVAAACDIINNLNEKKLLDFELSKYFLALSKGLKEKKIYDCLMMQSSLKIHSKIILASRHRFHALYLIGYKLKTIIKS